MCRIRKATFLGNIRNRALGILQQPKSVTQTNHPIKFLQALTSVANKQAFKLAFGDI